MASGSNRGTDSHLNVNSPWSASLAATVSDARNREHLVDVGFRHQKHRTQDADYVNPSRTRPSREPSVTLR